MLKELRLLISRLSPEVVVVERILFQDNARTAMSVGQASGLALAAAAEAGIPVVQYSPNEVKQAVTGWGNAGKDQVQRMVQTLLDLPEKPTPPDRADALALALCHLASRPLPGPWRPPAPGGRGVDRVAAGHGPRPGRAQRPPGRVAGRGGRAWATGCVVPAGCAGRAVRWAARRSCTCTPTCGRTPCCSTASRRREERDCFELLLGAHGVGPAVAVALLSVLSPAALRRAVLTEDADALTLVPGIGKPTAARLIIELTPRFEAAAVIDVGIAGGAAVGIGGNAGCPSRGQRRGPGRAARRGQGGPRLPRLW